jgi:hypothetical protein
VEEEGTKTGEREWRLGEKSRRKKGKGAAVKRKGERDEGRKDGKEIFV